jgi:4'-phosphopantetheinyl transferase EntD
MRATEPYRTHAIALATADEAGEAGAAWSPVDADYRASRLAARRAIRALVGPRTSVVVERRPGGPPLARVGGREAVALSLAHRDGLAVAIAARPGTRVGVDLERLDAVAPQHAHYFLTARERRATRLLPLALLWAIKEAVWKALTLGDDVPLAALELDMDGRGKLRGIWLRGERRTARATLMSPWPNYLVAAVRVGGRA